MGQPPISVVISLFAGSSWAPLLRNSAIDELMMDKPCALTVR